MTFLRVRLRLRQRLGLGSAERGACARRAKAGVAGRPEKGPNRTGYRGPPAGPPTIGQRDRGDQEVEAGSEPEAQGRGAGGFECLSSYKARITTNNYDWARLDTTEDDWLRM